MLCGRPVFRWMKKDLPIKAQLSREVGERSLFRQFENLPNRASTFGNEILFSFWHLALIKWPLVPDLLRPSIYRFRDWIFLDSQAIPDSSLVNLPSHSKLSLRRINDPLRISNMATLFLFPPVHHIDIISIYPTYSLIFPYQPYRALKLSEKFSNTL